MLHCTQNFRLAIPEPCDAQFEVESTCSSKALQPITAIDFVHTFTTSVVSIVSTVPVMYINKIDFLELQ